MGLLWPKREKLARLRAANSEIGRLEHRDEFHRDSIATTENSMAVVANRQPATNASRASGDQIGTPGTSGFARNLRKCKIGRADVLLLPPAASFLYMS